MLLDVRDSQQLIQLATDAMIAAANAQTYAKTIAITTWEAMIAAANAQTYAKTIAITTCNAMIAAANAVKRTRQQLGTGAMINPRLSETPRWPF